MNRQEWENLKVQLGRSKFRSSFKLGPKEKAYYDKIGEEKIKEHAREFLVKRLTPAKPENDGKQTSFRGHPVFIAQHATGTCCRSCLSRCHGIRKNKELSAEELDYILSVIIRWLKENSK